MNIAVVGAGNLGTGLAKQFALGGHAVALYDISPQALQRAQLRIIKELEEAVQQNVIDYAQSARTRKLVGSTTILEHCAEADMVFECAPEQIELKKLLFERLDKASAATVILASCTATISPTVIAAAAKRFPERVLGLFFPFADSKLIEIVRADQTSQEMVDQAVSTLQQLGKESLIAKDSPGFVSVRVTDAYTAEALRILGEGNLNAETIDKLMEALDFKTGPFHLLDQMGLDTSLNVKKALYEATFHEARFRPHPIHQKMVSSGRGFFKHD